MPELMDLLERSAYGHCDVTFVHSGEQMTFTDIWRRSADVARYLRARVGDGGAVATVLTNSASCLPNLFGIWRSGNDLVSLPHPGRGAALDRYQQQIEQMIALSGASILLVEARFLPMIPPMPVPVVSFEDALKGGPPGDTEGRGDLVQFTSGSIGTPKGVRLTQAAVAENILALIEAIGPSKGDIPLTWLPLSHDMGLIGMFLVPVVCLDPQIIPTTTFPILSPEYFLMQPTGWLEACARFGATITCAPNFAMELVSRARALHGPLDLSALRLVITGAERVSSATLGKFTSTFADAGLRPEVLSPAYGLAEATLAVSMVRPDESWRSIRVDRDAIGAGTVALTDDGGIEYVSNGRPMHGVDVRIDGPADGVGEVQIRTGSLLSDYLGADLRLTEDGFFPTRDLGFLHDGELFLVGRNDDTIIVGGKNYYAADVEATVQHAAVRPGNLAAVPLEDGFGLVVELRQDLAVAEQEQICRELSVATNQQMGIRPRTVAVVPRGRLYKTPSGKIQRRQLARDLVTGDLPVASSLTFGGSL